MIDTDTAMHYRLSGDAVRLARGDRPPGAGEWPWTAGDVAARLKKGEVAVIPAADERGRPGSGEPAVCLLVNDGRTTVCVLLTAGVAAALAGHLATNLSDVLG
jgi:hypothetical protein